MRTLCYCTMLQLLGHVLNVSPHNVSTRFFHVLSYLIKRKFGKLATTDKGKRLHWLVIPQLVFIFLTDICLRCISSVIVITNVRDSMRDIKNNENHKYSIMNERTFDEF